MHRRSSSAMAPSASRSSAAAVTYAIPVTPISAANPSSEAMLVMSGSPLARVRLCDIMLYDGASSLAYIRAVEALSGSLMRYNASVIELGSEDAALMRCGLEAASLFFRTRGQTLVGKGSHNLCMYRAGRSLEDLDSSPPCMAEIFRCMGKVARAALSAIARHLRLRSDVFNHLLDDTPLALNEVSSSVLVASNADASIPNGEPAAGTAKSSANLEVEKGLLTLFCSDGPCIQICDPNGCWYLADSGCGAGDLLLITGKSLSHATAGLRPAASYKMAPDHLSGTSSHGRTSLAFRLMPKRNAMLDCTPIEAAGHVIRQSYVPIAVSQFMDDLMPEDDGLANAPVKAIVARDDANKEPSLRSVLSDPISGAFLEDAMVVSCGHSFGGLMLRRVLEMSRCTLCSADIKIGSLIPNLALRAAAAAIKQLDDRRLFHNAAMRRRRKEMSDQMDLENGDTATEDGLHRAVQYPFAVNEKVLIKGNRRTPEKFVGKEAIVTSQCLNGWYLLKIVESGENVRLQYRSLKKLSGSTSNEERSLQQVQTNSEQ
ncbi:PREDICTED: uncharacterized protein LOC104809148 [Tarenaya hassleriana]|uniref:uncharacterized protein LOC104809148 n=1 Tax=Tarenaya hassleriana TaxID=28532 RepID=UPI00053C56FB|nr:PREDICTED: uncharacterized protein LOC104809148 [Tarenaya hassleriana]